ncbi:T9SS type A sorting domain-containing protein [Rhodohalobacter mucosus]|uniref:Secretion system C-terminal sorting domain-containing protein n=1 Tax=Rhodohalobacter mucosus TaxID=2079485 RepID=A0A316TVJ6_9BACT|nr:T9SS type A sorting domain-containing protein [Rhodohalobacter mucosus]PWN07135.1 hypothetical protein DDZ15_07680 [Rhodohalobacter mucosus]
MGYKLYLYLILPAVTILMPAFCYAQAAVSANVSEPLYRPGEQVEVLVSLDSPEDAYFFSAEIVYDPDVLTFISASHTGIFSDGLSISNELSAGRIGASAVRTSPLAAAAPGEMMSILFEVNRYSASGETLIRFENSELVNSLDQLIDHNAIADASVDVEEVISHVRLTTPAAIEVTEGDSFIATAELFASGITSSDGNEGRLTVWIGLNSEDTDPAGWDESVWRIMEYTGSAESFYQYEAEAALLTPVGTYYVAARAELDTNSEFFYGGIGDFWNAATNPSASLTLFDQPPFRYTIAAWNFDDERLTVTESIPQNDGSAISVTGAGSPGFAAGADGRAASASGWSGYDPENPKYWLIRVSTEGLDDIQLSSKHAGTSSSPRDFQIQVSTDGTLWSDVPGGSLTMTTSFNDAAVENLPLPDFADNAPDLYVRWLQTSDFRVDGDSIVTTGSNRIDDIRISGTNPGAARTEVWAGDTNNDQTVDEQDVLPLSAYWNSRGPLPVYPTRAWTGRDAEAWIPIEATYADANGDGVVNQNDLLPIGLHFGESRIGGNQSLQGTPMASLEVGELNAGEEKSFFIFSDEPIPVSGVSVRLRLGNAAEEDWDVVQAEGAEWSRQWRESGKLMEFTLKNDGGISSSVAYRGVMSSDEPVSLLAEIRIRALSDLHQGARAELIRVTALNGREMTPLEHVTISETRDGGSVGPVTEIPEKTLLMQNFPNPFNPATNIRYTLAVPSQVRIDIYNAAGRRVASLVEESQSAGEYVVPFNASSLSSGVYFYRLQTQNFTKTRSMVLIK